MVDAKGIGQSSKCFLSPSSRYGNCFGFKNRFSILKLVSISRSNLEDVATPEAIEIGSTVYNYVNRRTNSPWVNGVTHQLDAHKDPSWFLIQNDEPVFVEICKQIHKQMPYFVLLICNCSFYCCLIIYMTNKQRMNLSY